LVDSSASGSAVTVGGSLHLHLCLLLLPSSARGRSVLHHRHSTSSLASTGGRRSRGSSMASPLPDAVASPRKRTNARNRFPRCIFRRRHAPFPFPPAGRLRAPSWFVCASTLRGLIIMSWKSHGRQKRGPGMGIPSDEKPHCPREQPTSTDDTASSPTFGVRCPRLGPFLSPLLCPPSPAGEEKKSAPPNVSSRSSAKLQHPSRLLAAHRTEPSISHVRG
jgi:hypothetical protein